MIDPHKHLADEEPRLKQMNAILLQFGTGSRTCLGRHMKSVGEVQNHSFLFERV